MIERILSHKQSRVLGKEEIVTVSAAGITTSGTCTPTGNMSDCDGVIDATWDPNY